MNLITHILDTVVTKYVPPPVLERIGQDMKGRVFCFSAAEKRILKKRPPIQVSQWAERHRVVTMSKLQGPWHNSVTPYLTGIMDAMGFQTVHTIIMCAAPQVGKTECVNNFVGYAIDRAPGPVLYVYPDALTARENAKDRIIPMIEDSPRLRDYMTQFEDDRASLRVKLVHMVIYLAWAGSAVRLANRPIRYVVFDETDKYPVTPSVRETDPISLGEKRTITYRYDAKIFKTSTPTVESAPIWQALTQEAQVIFDYHVKCPACGYLAPMTFEQIRWDKECDEDGKERHPAPEAIEGTTDRVWYVCPACGDRWDDARRDRAVTAGEWVSRRGAETQRSSKEKGFSQRLSASAGERLFAYLQTHRPRKIGFHIPSWISPFVSMSAPAAAFLRGRHDKIKLRDFKNAHAAEPWVAYDEERQEDQILALRDGRPRGLVPTDAAVLTAAVDTQDDGFWYEIRAWCGTQNEESWQVREGFVPSNRPDDFAALEQVLWQSTYTDVEDTSYLVRLALIDAMGHRTAEVYAWARQHRGQVLCLQGAQTMKQPLAYSNIDVFPGSKKPIRGGLKLLRVHTNYFKNKLANKLEVHPGDPGAWHLHSEATLEWARQMCAEYLNDKGLWEQIASRANHAWDVSAYNLAAAEVLGVRNAGGPAAGQRSEARDQRSEKQGRWIERKGGWLRQ